MMKCKFWFTWAFAVSAMSSVSFGQILLYDGVKGAPDFSYNDFTVTTGASSFTVDTPADKDSANGLFGGAGIDVGPITEFENAGAVLRLELRTLPTNAAADFRMLLTEDDEGDVRDNFQYLADLSKAKALTDGSGFSELLIPISDGDRVYKQAATDFKASVDFVEDYGLAQWQIQSEFGGTNRLSLELRRVEIIIAADPEPSK